MLNLLSIVLELFVLVAGVRCVVVLEVYRARALVSYRFSGLEVQWARSLVSQRFSGLEV